MGAIVKRAGNLVETDVDDEIIIMRLDNGELLTLAGTAAAIWRLIDGNRDRAGLLAALAAEFAIGTEQIAPEVDEFIARLGQARLLADD